MAAPGATLNDAQGKMPLVVLSHGTGGSTFQMMWLGRRFAKYGFLAAAIDHHRNSVAEGSYDPGRYQMSWERMRYVSVAITSLLVNKDYGPQIDNTKIYAVGYSLDGNTMIGLAGGITNLE